jgi:uncharacterized lipoprotein YmbA
MRRLGVLATFAALVIFAVGCTSPSSRFYTLSAVPGPAAAPSNLSVSVGPVTIPAAVDRPQMVVTTGPNQAGIDEFNRWVGPLQNGIARVVAENLVAMLGTPTVSLFPQTIAAGADYYVAIEVQRFESTRGQAAQLDAFWTVTRAKDGKMQTGRTTMREPVTASDYEALAGAHSRALARLSRDVADAVQTLNQ